MIQEGLEVLKVRAAEKDNKPTPGPSQEGNLKNET
jgi:hypothetical protein